MMLPFPSSFLASNIILSALMSLLPDINGKELLAKLRLLGLNATFNILGMMKSKYKFASDYNVTVEGNINL